MMISTDRWWSTADSNEVFEDPQNRDTKLSSVLELGMQRRMKCISMKNKHLHLSQGPEFSP